MDTMTGPHSHHQTNSRAAFYLRRGIADPPTVRRDCRAQPQRSFAMFTKFRLPWRKTAMAAFITAAGIATASTAMAGGDCPADKVVADGKGQAMGPTMPKDVTDTVLAAIDLSKE